MASIQPRKNKEGEIISYQIKVTRGRDKLTGKQLTPYTMTFTPPETWSTWSRKAKEKELAKVSGEFEAACKRGEILTKEQEKQIAIDKQKEPDFKTYSDSYLKSEVVAQAKNTQALYKRICEDASQVFGDVKMKDISPVMIKSYIARVQTEKKTKIMRRQSSSARRRPPFFSSATVWAVQTAVRWPPRWPRGPISSG